MSKGCQTGSCRSAPQQNSGGCNACSQKAPECPPPAPLLRTCLDPNEEKETTAGFGSGKRHVVKTPFNPPPECNKYIELFNKPPWQAPIPPEKKRKKKKICRSVCPKPQKPVEEDPCPLPNPCAPPDPCAQQSVSCACAKQELNLPNAKKLSSPDELRSRIHHYIDNKPVDKRNPLENLTPFSGKRNDMLNKLICAPAEFLEQFIPECGCDESRCKATAKQLDIQFPDPSACNNACSNGNEKSNGGCGQSNGGCGQSNGGCGQSNGGCGQSNGGCGQSNGGCGQSNGGCGQSNGGCGQSNGGCGQSNGGCGQSNGGRGQSNGGRGQSNGGCSQSNGGCGQPSGGCGQPSGGCGQPSGGCGQPNGGCGQPNGGCGQPSGRKTTKMCGGRLGAGGHLSAGCDQPSAGCGQANCPQPDQSQSPCQQNTCQSSGLPKCPSKIDETPELLEEIQCYANVMPGELNDQQQLEFMQCMGASDLAICKYQQMQQAGGCGGQQQVDPCAQMAEDPCGQMGDDSCGQMAEDPCPLNDFNDFSACDCVEQPVGQDCEDDLYEEPACPVGIPVNICSMENPCSNMEAVLLPPPRLTPPTSAKDRKSIQQNYKQQVVCKACLPIEESSESDEDETPLLKHRMFHPVPKVKDRNMGETFRLYYEHLANIRRRYFGEVCKHIDEMDEITPEVAAAMVLTEEQGMMIKSAPANMYEYLYPESPSQPVMAVGEVTSREFLPEDAQNICVPLVPPMLLESAEFPGLEDPSMLDSPRVIQVGPSPNLAETPKPSEAKISSKFIEVVAGNVEVGLSHDLDELDEGDLAAPEDDMFDVKLQGALPPHFSRIQIRGSQAPNWFPGYYVAMPSKFGVDCLISCGHILEKAWEATQPEIVRPKDGACIVGQ